MFTTKLRIALTAAALCGAVTADARPRRIVVLDFDGPRTLADSGRAAILELLGDHYDIAAKKKWQDARTRASKNTYGPKTWYKAAKTSGVDAVIEGWVQDEGRHKTLNIVVREASTGREFDTLTFRFGKDGLSEETLGLVRDGLEDVLDYIEPGIEPSSKRLPELEPKRHLESKREVEPPPADDEEIEVEREAPRPEIAAAPDDDTRDHNDLVKLFGHENTDAWPLPKKPDHVPQPTPRFQIGIGGYYASRSLSFESEDPQDFLGVGTKGLAFDARAYPFPYKQKDGALTGFGIGVSLHKAPASTVTVQGEGVVADYKIDSGGWDASVRYRHPLGDIVHIDGHAGYGQEYFKLESDIELDVPDTHYKYFWGGANLDLSITERASVGFGARYLYITDTGDMSHLDWYGPGTASGFALDGNFLVPLPARLYVRGEIKYRRITTEFDAPDLSTEQARSASDGTVNGTVHVGIQF